MIAEALMLAALLHRSTGLVSTIYVMGGLDAVAVVECESQFNEKCWRREPRGHTSWGLFQIDDEFHPQHRNDLLLHIVEGVTFLAWCKTKGKDFRTAIYWYNGSWIWARYVERRRDSWMMYLWRRLR